MEDWNIMARQIYFMQMSVRYFQSRILTYYHPPSNAIAFTLLVNIFVLKSRFGDIFCHFSFELIRCNIVSKNYLAETQKDNRDNV